MVAEERSTPRQARNSVDSVRRSRGVEMTNLNEGCNQSVCMRWNWLNELIVA